MQTGNTARFPESGSGESESKWKSKYRRSRQATKKFLSSKIKHSLLLALIILDVTIIITEICIILVTCAQDKRKEPWVDTTTKALLKVALVFSSLFMVELLLTLWVEGFQYFSTWFHWFDAFVIVVSLGVDITDIAGHWVGGDVAALIVIFRLWRFVKIADEFGIEIMEQMEQMKKRVGELEEENAGLKMQLDQNQAPRDEEAGLS